MNINPFYDLIDKIIAFRDARDWKKFHNPKNISSSIVIEASELLELFQWTETENSEAVAEEKIENVKDEMSDILIYLLTLAHDLNIDLLDAANKKIDKNNQKYSVEKSKGNSKKYTEL